MKPRGYLAFVLHAHLPYVRHPEHDRFLEESWLFEALTECYVPLLSVLDGLVADGVDFRVTVGLTPTLVAMLQDELLRDRYGEHLDRLIELARSESSRRSRHEATGPLARFYAERFAGIRENWHERLGRDVVGAFRRLQEIGVVEIITSAATHGYLPHLRSSAASVRAQVQVGVESYRRAFGRDPEGFWLPECAYFPGLDEVLVEAGIRYFCLESHALRHAGDDGTYVPLVCPSGAAAFARDPETSRLVWSAEEGYPGDPDYRDFYRDLGLDAPPDTLGQTREPRGGRVATGLKYHRVTGRTPHKEYYARERALARVDVHAGDFVARVARRLDEVASRSDQRPVVVAPYDAELFGHWWFEGPEWLDRVLRRTAHPDSAVVTVTPSEYLAEYPTLSRCTPPAESSWGDGGYHEIWLNRDNDALYPRIAAAAVRLETLVRKSPGARGARAEALDQAAREVLLAQASDWMFLQRSGTAPDYARRRQGEHLDRFDRLVAIVENGAPLADADRRDLAEIMSCDAIFPWLDHGVFAPAVVTDEVSEALPRTSRVAFISAEAAPYAKAGGLGDVVGALPGALAGLDLEVLLVLPAYRDIDRDRFETSVLFPRLRMTIGQRDEWFRVLEARSPGPGVRVLLVDHPGFFDRDGIYVDPATGSEYPDSAERFLFFSRAAIETLSRLGKPIDVLHCHDHQTAAALAVQRFDYRDDPALAGAAGIFTLHNLGYQGIHDAAVLDFVGIDRSWFYPGSPFEYWGKVNLMKIGIVLADKVNAVSETYAREIREHPELSGGLGGVLEERGPDLVGILNGIDVEEWDPASDPHLPSNYSCSNRVGKRTCKKQLLETLGLDPSHVVGVPLVGMVTRLVDQKGLDLIEEGLDDLMALGVDLAILGTGLPKYHDMLEEAARRFPGRVGVVLRFDNAVAHLIEAGADMFLMPSLYEPCGLNQMYSLRYGTVPVVRSTGGLADTVRDDDATPDGGVGFSFEEYTAAAMLDAVERAVKAYGDRQRWARIVCAAMGEDHSWTASAKRYLELYDEALQRRRESLSRDRI